MMRCEWAKSDLMIEYHDTEWGVPLYDDRKLFEFLVLEGVQAGLSWEIVLRKRENYRKAFHRFDPVKISKTRGDPFFVCFKSLRECLTQNAVSVLGLKFHFDKSILQFKNFTSLTLLMYLEVFAAFGQPELFPETVRR